MFRNLLKTRLGGESRRTVRRSRSSIPLCLEELETRLTPSTTVVTDTSASIQIIPNYFAFTVTEQVTATVTMQSPPSGTPNASGTVFFNLNNQQQQAQLNSNGQATASFTLPLLALFASQELTAQYAGASITSPSDITYQASTFNAPLYLNFYNLLFPANVTFNSPSTQSSGSSGLPPYNTAQGETDSFGQVSFHYVDPGIITSIEAFGQTYSGSFGSQSTSSGASTRDFIS